MKNIYKITLLALSIVAGSCGKEFLEPAPISSLSAVKFFASDSEIEAGIINMYDGIQGVNSTSANDRHAIQYEFYLTEMRSDNTRTKSSEGEAAQFESYTLKSTNGIVADYYASFYNVIYRANLVLDNLGAASDGNRDAYEGEAKFVRAYAYFNLVRLYGDIPLVTSVVNLSDEEATFTRVAVDEVYKLIISDLTTAKEHLDNTYKSRASKAAAQALLAKVYLTRNNYAEAVTLCKEVMSSGFKLQENFKDVFFKELNDEIIFAIAFVGDNANDSQNFSAEWLNGVGRTSGVNYVTDEVKEAFSMIGGNRTQYSIRIDIGQPTQNQVVKYLPNGDKSLEIEPTSNSPTSAGNDWIVLRYADVLLMHVEAIMGTNQETSDADALTSFQLVRNRAGRTDPVTRITKQELLDERRVELAFENHRLFDLIRFGVAEEVLSGFSSSNGYSFENTDLLLPIPQREIGLSKGKLKQNTGYEN